MEEHGEIFAAIGDIQDEVVTKYLLSDVSTLQNSSHDFEVVLSGLVSKLQMTAKTHKPQDEVIERAVRASYGSPLKLAYRWISHEVRKITNGSSAH